MKLCEHCGKPVDASAPEAPAAKPELAAGHASPADSSLAVEFDHRGIRLPARTRVGGIIIPQ
jgi:hypothetical protein